MQLAGDGVGEGEVQEGNEEGLSHFSDSLVINELMHAVKVPNDSTIDAQRVPYKLRESAKNRLKDWWAKRYSVTFFNQVCGYTPQTNTKYTGLNAVTAPAASRRVFSEAGTSIDEDLDSSGDLFRLDLIDFAVELAKTADVPVPPVMVDGQEKYILYMHPYQVTDLRTDAANAISWFDLNVAGLQGGRIKNPIYTNALGEYHNVILRESFDVTQGVHSVTGAAVSTVRRAVLLGAQAASMAFGQKYDEDGFEWVEELFDYKRNFGVSAQNVFGMKKNRFNSVDYGAIVISTYAVKHTP